MPTKIGLHYNKIGVGKTIYFLHGMGLDGHSMAAFYEPRFTSEERHFARLYRIYREWEIHRPRQHCNLLMMCWHRFMLSFRRPAKGHVILSAILTVAI